MNDLGEDWAECISAFIKFETAHGFKPSGGHLPWSSERPDQLNNWIATGHRVPRSTWDRICSEDPDVFGGRWIKWWLDIQLEGQHKDDIELLTNKANHVDWRTLCKHGGNGVFLVLLTLLWWGLMLKNKGVVSAKWVVAVKNLIWVLSDMVDGSLMWETIKKKRRSVHSVSYKFKLTVFYPV